MNVTLRERPLKKGKLRLYLSFYPAIVSPKNQKKTRWESLRLYIYQYPQDELQIRHNAETLKLAESICAKRQLKLQQELHGVKPEVIPAENFTIYFKEVAGLKRGSNRHNWNCAFRYFEQFSKQPVRFTDLTIKFCEQYKNYLLSGPKLRTKRAGIKHNSALSYFTKFRAVIRRAWREKLLKDNLYEFVPALREKETYVEYLTMEELQRMIKVQTNDPLCRRAVLFAVLTGLRFSDVQSLRWSTLREESGNYHLQLRQIKTGTIVYLPIADQAHQLMEQGKTDSPLVFPRLNYNRTRDFLKSWVTEAGIGKHLTFNCLRHTYATLQLDNGSDIYTVSKMLGHRHLKTTLRYTKVMDKKKREATERIVLEL
jgi:integrase